MTEEKKETAQAELPALSVEGSTGYLLDPKQFEHGLRVAKMFAASKLVPDVYKNNPADCFLVLHRAATLNVEPMYFMEHSFIVHGKVGVDGQFCKAQLDSSGLFKEPVELVYSGSGDTRKCVARGVLHNGKTEEAEVSVALAKAEGWWDKNPKWKNMTDQMLGYRAFSFFCKRHHPGLLGGLHLTEEIIDVEGVQVIRSRRVSSLNEQLTESTTANAKPA